MVKFGHPVFYSFGPPVINLVLQFSIYSVLQIWSYVPVQLDSNHLSNDKRHIIISWSWCSDHCAFDHVAIWSGLLQTSCIARCRRKGNKNENICFLNAQAFLSVHRINSIDIYDQQSHHCVSLPHQHAENAPSSSTGGLFLHKVAMQYFIRHWQQWKSAKCQSPFF